MRLDFAKALVPAMTGQGKQQIDLSKEWFDLLHVHELASLGRFAAVFFGQGEQLLDRQVAVWIVLNLIIHHPQQCTRSARVEASQG
ncbi:hypothetical protein C206_26532 [Pseudomonas putida TRO1]|uniref:Uncharacterized protein n=1 Tax=Pseudomonas putida TRO1 TaxID=1227924 RepID=A0AAD2ZRH4_PSEPU|nr:hypothetical protein C206_26532 [Pseudomonas putida TRO1]